MYNNYQHLRSYKLFIVYYISIDCFFQPYTLKKFVIAVGRRRISFFPFVLKGSGSFGAGAEKPASDDCSNGKKIGAEDRKAARIPHYLPKYKMTSLQAPERCRRCLTEEAGLFSFYICGA